MNAENGGTSTFMSRLEELEKEEAQLPIQDPKTPPRVTDGIILIAKKEDTNFLNPNDISPILKSKFQDESLHRITEEDEDGEDDLAQMSVIACNKELFKRKRQEDSFDNISLASTDSLAPSFSSAKKPKLIRTGSITKNLRRSMSFAAIKTPLSNMLRSRRNSASIADPNASISSISSINSTFNESIKKPVKEKLRSIRDKITKSSKKDLSTPKNVKGLISNANMDSLKKVCKIKGSENETTFSDAVDFKTPLAPPRTPSTRSLSSAHTFSKSMITANEFIALHDTPTTTAFDRIAKNVLNAECTKEIEEKAPEPATENIQSEEKNEQKPVHKIYYYEFFLYTVWF